MAAPPYGSEEDTAAALPSVGSCHRSCRDPATKAERRSLNSVITLPSMAQCRDRAQVCPVCCELGWGAAASQYCVRSGEQLQFSFLTCCAIGKRIFCLMPEEHLLKAKEMRIPTQKWAIFSGFFPTLCCVAKYRSGLLRQTTNISCLL